jgi:peptide chain release factor 3
MTMAFEKEIEKRRTFAIISHPDAGKTTLTEKLLLYGGAIQMAGAVKAKRAKKFATSDWLEIEKQRGISVTSSVMKFPYEGFEINLIDTPGHQDFSEDTYRTLTAVDSALMLIDAANGVEAQTIKLFEVCRMRATPILSFINKMDRDGKDAFSLLDEIEKVLGIKTYPMTWPIGQGADFRGVYDRKKHELLLFEQGADKARPVPLEGFKLDSPKVREILGDTLTDELLANVELLEAAGDEFSHAEFLQGKIAPVFFGSALNNFGVQVLLDALTQIAPPPLPRKTKTRDVNPLEAKFSGFIFKIQANMDPQHRDRVAFIRICSGQFTRGMKAFHVRHKKEQRLGRPTQFMAQDRSLVDEAYAGDIVGVHDPGVFMIGDSLSEGEDLQFTGVPVFAPEHFMRVTLADPLKSKQLNKALDQLSEEGAVQVFRPVVSNEQWLGVVGVLQFDVVKFRIEAEYGVKVKLSQLPYTAARWIGSEDKVQLEAFRREQSGLICLDRYGKPAILIDQLWRLKFLNERYPKIQFYSTSEEHELAHAQVE